MVLKEKCWHGETFYVDTAKRTMTFHLRKPFEGAHRHFKWHKKICTEYGVGINKFALEYAQKNFLVIVVETGGLEFVCAPEVWFDFAKHTGSVMTKGQATLYVLPLCAPFLRQKGTVGDDVLSSYFGED